MMLGADAVLSVGFDLPNRVSRRFARCEKHLLSTARRVEAVSWVAGRVDKNRRALIGATYRDVLRWELPIIRFTCASDYPFHLCGLTDVISA